MNSKAEIVTQRMNPSSLSGVLVRFGIVTSLYIALVLTLPVSALSLKNLGLDAAEYRFLLIGIALPSFTAWLAAFVGYAKLHDYADSVENTKEGIGYKKLANGITFLAWSLPITSLTALLLSTHSYRNPDFYSTAIIIINYVAVALPLLSFILIGKAAKVMAQSSERRFSMGSAKTAISLFTVAGLSYCYFTFSRFDDISLNSTSNPYFLPLWLMVLTITIPSLCAWYNGMQASYEIFKYSQKMKGILYKQALQLLVAGLIIVVLSLIALQYINSASPRTGYLYLNYKLVAISCFRFVAALGFVLISYGAIKLKRIEEV
ncbi:MAG: hypothetical protein QFB86_00435 [Patescibacteria group bacterium]|nr:hypothetical protein [Patescibacteria group bacterium]